MHDIYSKNTAYSNVTHEYFANTEGYPAGLVYAEMSASGFTIKLATIYIDLTLDSDGSDFVMASLTLTWIDSLDEAKSLANGVMRYKGTPIISDPDDDSGSSDEGDPREDNSDKPENMIPVEDTLICDFQDWPISICFPQDTLIDLYRSYSENGSWTQAHYLPGLNNAKFPSFIINSYTEMNYESLDEWAAHVVDSWNLSEVNATISTNRFQTGSGFPGIWVTREYSGFMGTNSFDYFIAIDLSTDAWKQRHLQNQYAEDEDWLRIEFQGSNALTNEDEFETALAVAKSLDYNQSHIPDTITYVAKSTDLSTSTKLLVNELNSGWFFSDWLGLFFDSGSGWIYHEHLEWIYWSNSTHGSWIWADGKDWLWTAEDSFPYLYSDNTKDWVYLSFSEQDLPNAYDFSNETWSNWSDLVLNKIISLTTQGSSDEEANAIEEIYYSDSMSEEEKIDAIGSIILFGL